MGNAAAAAPEERRLHGEYWSALTSGAACLTASECTRCGNCYLPAIATCVACKGRKFRARPLTSTGTLYTYTIVRDAGGVWPSRYTIGYVDFATEKVRVCGHVRETDPSRLRVGMPVGIEEAVLYTESAGTRLKCFRFHALEGSR